METLHEFTFLGDEGAFPWGGLVQGNDGDFYGTTRQGGANGSSFGTVFKITATGQLTTLASLDATNGGYPYSGLLQGSDGAFYGSAPDDTASSRNSGGTIFRMTGNGELSTLATFHETNGANPFGLLFQDSDGAFYGSTHRGGLYGEGLIFRINQDGVLTPLVFFDSTNGSGLMTSLMKASDGNLYGTTQYGGTYHSGTVFRMTTAGVLTTLVEFNGTNGYSPWGGRLVKGRDGDFYGTTLRGGKDDFGTIFKMTPSGELTTLISFNGTNGGYPYAGLIQGADGNFYGVTSQFWPPDDGKFPNYGTVFRLTEAGVLSTLATLNRTNGTYPWAALVQGRDGNLYGTTRNGGTNNFGTVFKVVMPVTLNSRVSGDELVLSWPTNALAFTLQATADLNFPINWIDSTNAPAIVGAQFTVTNSLSASAQFYRLKKP